MVTNTPFFSIVIPTYNRGNLISRCIDSIIAQTYTNWEAIIVDNYSEDNTENIVLSYNDDRIRFIKNHNYGVIAVSRNKALEMAKGDWICFLDSDDTWLPNKLETILPYVEKYDLVYHGYILNVDKSYPRRMRHSYFYKVRENTLEYVIQRGDPFSPSCTSISRKSLGHIRFDESRDLFAVEDYDFFLQILEKGVRIKYLKKLLSIYELGGCSQDDKSIDRDCNLYMKWKPKLSSEVFKQVLNVLEYKKAGMSRKIRDYKTAQNLYFKILKTSSIPSIKFKALKGYCISKLHCLLDKPI